MTTQDIEQNPALFHKKYRSAQHRITTLRERLEAKDHIIQKLRSELAAASKELAVYEDKENIKKSKGESVSARNKVESILKEVEPFYPGMTYQAIMSQSRKRDIAEARHLVSYFLRHKFQFSFVAIGRIMGKRDHSTIVNSCNRVDDLCRIYKQFRVKVSTIESQL